MPTEREMKMNLRFRSYDRFGLVTSTISFLYDMETTDYFNQKVKEYAELTGQQRVNMKETAHGIFVKFDDGMVFALEKPDAI